MPPTPSADRRMLGLFAKEPRPGRVKSRLAAETTPEWAARVAAAFLRDLVVRLAAVDARRVLAFAPPEAEPYFAGLACGRFVLRPQCDGDLGRRLADFFAAALQDGAEQVVVVGSDSPTLPLAHVAKAFAELERADVVLGPAADGGYYLLGCAGRVPPLFEGIPWGGARVLWDTVARLGGPGWNLAVLPPWYDVDTLDDWWALRGHLAALRRAGIDPEVPHTEQLAAGPGGDRNEPIG
jgi:rSAM/selenodomain-associated transferase 1